MTGLFQDLLYGARFFDPETVASVPILLSILAPAVGLIAARRAPPSIRVS